MAQWPDDSMAQFPDSSLVTVLKIFFLRSYLVFCHRIIKLVTGESRGADCSSPQKTKRRRSGAEASSRGACREGPFCCGGRRPRGGRAGVAGAYERGGGPH